MNPNINTLLFRFQVTFADYLTIVEDKRAPDIDNRQLQDGNFRPPFLGRWYWAYSVRQCYVLANLKAEAAANNINSLVFFALGQYSTIPSPQQVYKHCRLSEG